MVFELGDLELEDVGRLFLEVLLVSRNFFMVDILFDVDDEIMVELVIVFSLQDQVGRSCV